jgi:serine/threonine protein kinase
MASFISRMTAKIADFGMAHAMLYKCGGRYTDRLVTHWYRPPEIILGDTQYTTTVDMWSLGCILVPLPVVKQ